MPDESLPIIPHAGSGLAISKPQGGRIVEEMVSGALALTRSNAALIPRFTIGEHVFCEPDYRQVLLWAEQLGMQPQRFLESLLSEQIPNNDDGFDETGTPYKKATVMAGGRFVKLYWNLDKLPLSSFEWVNGLTIEELTISCHGNDDGPICTNDEEYLNPPALSRHLALPLPRLRRLDCGKMNRFRVVDGVVVLGINSQRFTSIDLSNTPLLEHLDCSWNQITSLDLSRAPKLKTLNCRWNQLSSLDLLSAPHLKELSCGSNHLMVLGVSNCRQLHRLDCRGNHITCLDLSNQPDLRFLDCSCNQLISLDLRCAQKLEQLKCTENFIKELDIRTLPITKPVGDLWNGMEITVEYDKEKTRLIQRPDQHF